MAFINLDSVHYYQPPPFAGRPVQRRPGAQNRGGSTLSNEHCNPMAGAPNIIGSVRLEDFDLIENINLASSLPIDSLGLPREPALDSRTIESYACDSSITPDLIARHEENDNAFPPLKELLRGAEEAEDPQYTVLSVAHGSGRPDGFTEYLTRTATDTGGATLDIGAIGIRDSSKRTAVNAGLDEGPEGVPKSEKVRYTESDNADDDQSLPRIPSRPKPFFRRPPFLRDFQQRGNILSSSRHCRSGDSQDTPLVVEDDDRIPGELDTLTKFPSNSTQTPPQQSTARIPVSQEEQWEISEIVGKRRAGMDYEYEVRWKNTWLPRSELGNAQRLLYEFEAKSRW